MNWKILFLAVTIGGLSIFGSNLTAAENKNSYVGKVGQIFRLHLESIELLATSESRYAGNLVRHAMAMSLTADLLDSVILAEVKREGENKKWPWRDNEEYEKLYSANVKAINELIKAASAWLDGGQKAPLTKAIGNVNQTCDNCHGGKSSPS